MLWNALRRSLCKFRKPFQGIRTTGTFVMAQSDDSTAASSSPTLAFDNLVLRELPVDSSRKSGSRQVSGACFSLVTPTPVSSPKVVAVSKPALALLDISDLFIKNQDFAEYFSGNKVMEGSETASHCYCGHQFGYFSGQLGDGAAVYLGEIVNKKGERWELQLKGAGLTPYSRTADGRKVLRSSIREFLCSEAMHNLGIPTTRAGSCITSESRVIRDIFYDGNPKNEQCTIVSRIAETFLRFGSFEIFKPTDEDTGRVGPSVGQHDILEKMLDYVLHTFYPNVKEKFPEKESAYIEMYREICHRTAKLVARWQCVGFCHGVLNTDNMSIMGLTIDYGPFGFMERYDPNYICNGSDDGGRYSYKNQPDICEWNLKKLAEAWQWIVPMEKTLEACADYKKVFMDEYLSIMRAKLGISRHELHDDGELVKELLQTMEDTNADFTNTFRALSKISLPSIEDFADSKEHAQKEILNTCFTLEELKTTCKPRMDPRQLQSLIALARENPRFLHILTGGKMGMIMTELTNLEKMEALENLTEESLQEKYIEKWDKWLDAYSKRLETDLDGCQDVKQWNKERVVAMNAANPSFILRNHIAQNAIEEAENGNFDEVNKFLELLQSPFSETISEEDNSHEENLEAAACSAQSGSTKKYTVFKTPTWALQLKVT